MYLHTATKCQHTKLSLQEQNLTYYVFHRMIIILTIPASHPPLQPVSVYPLWLWDDQLSWGDQGDVERQRMEKHLHVVTVTLISPPLSWAHPCAYSLWKRYRKESKLSWAGQLCCSHPRPDTARKAPGTGEGQPASQQSSCISQRQEFQEFCVSPSRVINPPDTNATRTWCMSDFGSLVFPKIYLRQYLIYLVGFYWAFIVLGN